MSQENELVKHEFNFQITSLDQAMQYAKLIADSDLAPKDYKGKPGNVLIAMQYGAEIGLKPMQSIQNIAVINGRPSLWGDAMIALVQSHPVCEYIRERFENGTAYCTVKRRDDDEDYTYEFSKEDAKTAGLLTKPGVWAQYPERMLQMRARSFALRDRFSDVLKGISMREEVQDYVIEGTVVEKKKEALNKLENLIARKKALPNYKLNVFEMMENAKTLEELDKAAEFAKTLDDEQKKEAREVYKQKYLSFVSIETGEVTDDKN